MASYTGFLVVDQGIVIQPKVADTTTVLGNVVVDNDLTVNGTFVTNQSEEVLIQDNYLDLNFGYTTVAAKKGGFTVNYLPTNVTSAVAAGGFPAGGVTVTVAASGAFAAGDIIMVSGANDKSNDGIYEVASENANVITIDATPTEAFCKNAFEVDATVAGAVTKITVAVLQAKTDGDWEIGKGATAPITYDTISTSSAGTVTADNVLTGVNNQNASFATQGNGNTTITSANAAATATIVSATNAAGGVQINAGTGGVDIDATALGSGSGNGAFTVNAGAASTIGTATGELTLTASNAAGGVSIFSGTGGVDIDATAAGGGSGDGAFTVEAAAASSIGTKSGSLTLAATAADGSVGITAGTGGVDIDITSGGAGSGNGALTVNAGAASTIDVASGNLTLSTTTSGTIAASAADALTLTGGANSTWSTSAGTLTISGLAGLDLQENGATRISVNDDGAIAVTSAAAQNVDLQVNGVSYLLANSATTTVQATKSLGYLGTNVAGAATGTTIPHVMMGSGAATTQYHLMAMDSDGQVLAANANSGTAALKNPIGVAIAGVVGAATALPVCTFPGSMVQVVCHGTPLTNTATDAGKFVFLSSQTSGTVELAAPVAGRIYQIGIIQSVLSTSTAWIVFQPQFVADV